MIIRIASHRAWDRVKFALGFRPKGLFNMEYPGSYGLCEVSEQEWEKIKDIPSVGKSRVKRESLMQCWTVTIAR